jgi:hypothetical protein
LASAMLTWQLIFRPSVSFHYMACISQDGQTE